jgi:hypothetical protein
MSWRLRDIDLCVARIEAMHVLLRAGWEPRRIALVLGMERSLAIAEHWMYPDRFPAPEYEAAFSEALARREREVAAE